MPGTNMIVTIGIALLEEALLETLDNEKGKKPSEIADELHLDSTFDYEPRRLLITGLAIMLEKQGKIHKTSHAPLRYQIKT